jgi:hypothetical protein
MTALLANKSLVEGPFHIERHGDDYKIILGKNQSVILSWHFIERFIERFMKEGSSKEKVFFHICKVLEEIYPAAEEMAQRNLFAFRVPSEKYGFVAVFTKTDPDKHTLCKKPRQYLLITCYELVDQFFYLLDEDKEKPEDPVDRAIRRAQVCRKMKANDELFEMIKKEKG